MNTVQIKELSDIMGMLDAALEDPQQRYYIVVDRLDENWVEDKLRYRLIRALVETVRDFRHVRHAKLIVALRLDLLDRIVRLTRDAGFQEEKYESLYVKLDWTKASLMELLDSRVQYLVRSRYTKTPVLFADVVSSAIGGKDPFDYILERTMMRPRDVIMFFNLCIAEAVDSPAISAEMMKRAEGEYSRARLRSLADEWNADYPNLLEFVDLLKGQKTTFKLAELTEKECADICLKVATEVVDTPDALSLAAQQVVEEMISVTEFRDLLIQIFYKIGLVGLKLKTFETTSWSRDGRRTVSRSEITDDLRVSVHPFAWRTLGIRPEK